MSEDMSEVVSLEITFKGQFNKVNKVLSFDTSTNMSEITSPKILFYNMTMFLVFGHASKHISLYKCIRVPFWRGYLSGGFFQGEWRHKLYIQWCAFVGQSEPIHQEVRTYLLSLYLYHLLNRSGDLEGVHIRLAFLRVGAYNSLSFSLFKWLHSLLPCRRIIYKFYLLSHSLLVVA